LFAVGDGSTIRPRNAARVNVQSVVLQLFLSIIGVCLTRIELLAHWFKQWGEVHDKDICNYHKCLYAALYAT